MIAEEKKQVLELFSQGRKLYKLMEFAQAKIFFTKALRIDSEDGPSKVYFTRCKHYIEKPPSEDWDGVFVMKCK